MSVYNASHTSFSLLTPEEFRKQIYTWNETDKPYPNETIHGLFESQAKETPEHTALVFEGESRTYRTLNAEANQLARYLRKHYNIKPDALIAVQIDRSLELIIALLGVLKSGAAYVPIDLDYPKTRVDYILEDTKALVVLDDAFFEQKPYLDESKRNLTPISAPSDLAYVIYTSGTTGTPKGVMIEHKGINNYLAFRAAHYQLDEHAVVLQKTPYQFDVSVWELFGTLQAGAKLIIAKPGGHQDSGYLSQLMFEQQVTHIHFVPSMLSAFMQVKTALPDSLRFIFCSGEALSASVVQAAYEAGAAHLEIHNLYGPTEASIDVSAYPCPRGADSIPIGKPIQNIQLYVLDKSLNPLPIGAIGELYISGAGLARGYLNQPELTKESFISHAFGRLYKTGDLVRRLTDGNLGYVGRKDTQVKIRGYRIELGEIEHTLNLHPLIKQSAVVVHNEKLVAYYIGEAEDLEDYLSQKLPGYMVPSLLIVMDAFPLTKHGKLDRKALPLPDWAKNTLEYIAPRTALESKLCEIWQDILSLERVGIEDDFFRLGGDSILSIRLVASMKQSNVCVTARDLLVHRTIKSLLASSQKASTETSNYQPFSLVSTEQIKQLYSDQNLENIEDIYPASYLQMGMLFESSKDNAGGIYHDIFTYYITAQFDEEKFLKIWQQLVARHALLRASFIPHEAYGYLIVVWQNLALDTHYQQVESTNDFDLILEEKRNALPLEAPGLFRLLVSVTSEKEFRLVFSFHHAIADGWGVASLMSELTNAYVHFTPVKNIALPSYGQVVAKERAILANEKYEDFWRNYLASYELKHVNFLLNQNKVAVEEQLFVRDEMQSSHVLLSIAKNLSVSPDIIFLSIYLLTAARFYAANDIVIGVLFHNRLEETGGDEVLGLHLNMLPLRVKVSPEDYMHFEKFILHVAAEKLKLEAYKAYPYDKVRSLYASHSGQELTQLYQFSFTYTHFHTIEPFYQKQFIRGGRSFEKTSIPFGFNINRHGETFKYAVKGSPAFIDAEMAQCFLLQFNHHLKRLLKIEQNINYVYLPAEAYQKQIYTWNETDKPYPLQTIQGLFESQVKKTPDHTALVFGDDSLTYRALNAEANQLAHYLRKHYDIKPDALIAIHMARGFKTMIALLGILKSGAAYVPIGLSTPKARVDIILEDSKALFMLDDAFFAHKPYLGESQANLIPLSTPNDLAYVIYTSGTTGTPKGVMVEHRNVVNLLYNQREAFGVHAETKALQCASLAFDASVFEVFVALLSGATLCIVEDATRAQSFIEQYQLTLATFTPSLLSELDATNLESLETVVVAGEVCNASVMSAWSKGRRLINAYGPTEGTVCALMHEFEVGDSNRLVGKPLFNVRAYVLDRYRNPVPIGAIGELYISGAGVARGYLNQPELTEARFISHAFGRLYKTGDLVRRLADGNLEYIGRNDTQVKIRGFRIELSEIEHVLSTHPSVKQSAVVVHDDKLVAYYVGEAEGLEAYLEERLPPYMVPSILIELGHFPLTKNGKLDKRALPKPDFSPDTEIYVTPRNEIENLICQIWQNALQVPQIGIKDDFFALGGHSILAMQVAHKLSRLLKREVLALDLFKHRTIKALCALLKGREALQAIPLYQGDRAPLSYGQERLWFIEQYEEVSPYHIVIKQPYSPELIESLHRLVSRHEILRTRFVVDELGSYQEVHNEVLPIEAISQLDMFIQRKFDLTKGHPLRVGRYENDLVLVLHHIAFDAWSRDIIFQEIASDKEAPLEIQYKDFAAWQRGLVESRWDELKAYWLERLAGVEALQLPTDYKRPARIDYQGSSVAFDLPLELQAFSEKHQVTPFTLCLTVLGVLLSRYTGQKDILIGTPVTNREHPQLAPLIGFFINTLVLKLSIKDTTFSELLAQIQSDFIEAQAYQEMPFERLVDVLDVQRDTSRHPVFQVMYNLRHDSSVGKRTPLQAEIAKFDLDVSIVVTPTKIKGRIQYATSLFKKETIERLMGHYQTLLSEILKAPNKLLNQYSLLSSDEYQEQVYGWNKTDKSYLPQTIQAVFEVQVKETPDHTALVFEGSSLTYRALNAEANQLARYLRKHYDIKPDALIAVQIDRSFELMIALLGILKSGAAFVPIDLSMPKARLDFILKDTNALLILDDTFFKQKPYLNESKGNLTPISTPSDLAYVIYTSGTTGQPKGVMIEHGSVHNYLDWQAQRYYLNEQHVVLHKIPYQFDISVWEIFGTLQQGATLVITKPEGHKDNHYLNQLMCEHKVTHAYFIPSMLSTFTQTVSQFPDTLQTIFCVGEALTPTQAQAAYQKSAASLKIHNLYGPTEATINVTAHTCPRDADSIPIGKPIQNIQLYVLDKSLNPLPIGAVGELYISGAGLARGYLNQPELTEASFISHVFGRLYKTGDLVRRLADGNLEYIGRTDTQVKLHGFRIELGEIEHQICQYPGIKNAAVMLEGEGEGQYLVGYYVSKEPLNEPEILDKLAQNLPNFMIPRVLEHLLEFPLTVNGKLDRKHFPKLSLEPGLLAYDPPRTIQEVSVAKIWCEVLQLDKCESISSSFFEMGGTSLLSISFLGKLNTVFSLELTLKDLFEKFTIRQIAKKIESSNVVEWTPLVSIGKQSKNKPSLYILPGAIGCSSAYYPLATLLSKSFSVSCIEAKGLYGNDEPHVDVHEMLDEYHAAILANTPSQKLILLGHSSGCTHTAELGFRLRQQGFIVKLIFIDGPIDFSTRARKATYTDADFEYVEKLLLRSIRKLYSLSYQEDFDIESSSTALKNIGNCLFPDPSIDASYKLKVAKGFVSVFASQGSLNAEQTRFEAFGQIEETIQTLFINASEDDFVPLEETTENIRKTFPQLAMTNCSGDHLTILSKQHVEALAEKIINFIQQEARLDVLSSSTATELI